MPKAINMARETWKFLKETELSTVSCFQEQLGKFYCLRKNWFSPKEDSVYMTLDWEFYYANKSIPYRGYVHSFLHSRFPLLDCPQNITISSSVSLKSLTGCKKPLSWWVMKQRWKEAVNGLCQRETGKNNPPMCCVWLNCEAVQFFISVTYHFLWVNDYLQKRANLYSPKEKFWSEYENTTGVCWDMGLLFTVGISTLRWSSCQFKTTALEQSPMV